MRERTETFGLGHTLKFICEDFDDDGKWLDTRVYLNKYVLLIIAGEDVDAFRKDFFDVMDKYGI